MGPHSRRKFLDNVGRGMLMTGLGASLALDLGVGNAFSKENSPENTALPLGSHADLVRLLQETPADKLQPLLVDKLSRGETDLGKLISAAALANAEIFGGHDYVGFHTAMAMLPALGIKELLPTERQPLPILKVIYRNAQQIQQFGGASKKTLQELHEAEHAAEQAPDTNAVGLKIREATRTPDLNRAESLFVSLKDQPTEKMLEALQPAVQDEIDVHRFVFAYRTYGLSKLLGHEFAHTLLRQCLGFCVDAESNMIARKYPGSGIRTVLPKLIDQYKLASVAFGKRDPGDAWVDATSLAIYNGPADRAADVVAAALADGVDPEVVGEAISLASNLLILRQGQGGNEWRTHGDSRGVHSSDATNAWRNMARVMEPQHAASGLIVAAYHSARHGAFATPAYPTAEHRALIKMTDPVALLNEADDAVRHNDQARAAAAIQLYGEGGHAPAAVLERMLKFTISEDGRLHGEKYFHTVTEEYRTTREAFRWRQMVALARVTASSFGYDRQDKHGTRAPGYEEACRLLGVEA